jgi:hypothetical protein
VEGLQVLERVIILLGHDKQSCTTAWHNTHRISRLVTSRSQNAHSGREVRLKVGADGHRDIAEARHNGDLDLTIEYRALQALEEHSHESVAIGGSLFTEGSTNISYETNCDGTELRILIGLQCRA